MTQTSYEQRSSGTAEDRDDSSNLSGTLTYWLDFLWAILITGLMIGGALYVEWQVRTAGGEVAPW